MSLLSDFQLAVITIMKLITILVSDANQSFCVTGLEAVPFAVAWHFGILNHLLKAIVLKTIV